MGVVASAVANACDGNRRGPRDHLRIWRTYTNALHRRIGPSNAALIQAVAVFEAAATAETRRIVFAEGGKTRTRPWRRRND